MPARLPAPDALPILQGVHNADVGGVRLRFYLPPTPEPGFPWASYSDVQALATPDEDLERFFIRNARAHVRFGRDGKMRVCIIPFWLANEMIRTAANAGCCDKQARREFSAEAEVALRSAAQRLPQGQQTPYREAARERLRGELGGD